MTNSRRGPESASWRGDDVSYFAVHQRLRRTRGNASAHVCPCGQPARQWSYVYRDGEPYVAMQFSTDLTRYRPLCESCHKRYDASRPGAPVRGTPTEVRQSVLMRLAAGESQATIARELGMTQQAVSRWVVHARSTQEG